MLRQQRAVSIIFQPAFLSRVNMHLSIALAAISQVSLKAHLLVATYAITVAVHLASTLNIFRAVIFVMTAILKTHGKEQGLTMAI
ncbi:MAG: hypothetical protein DIZ80_02025 [endosymbiont of Galathealinum brachiosum]|uniref:Uncharacterized protein n=1 Tax=endosymbiont of Galathealinum brachiosum TaxID=2200906 RepID=A0A370DLG2_9GAMM|nr:MAG: hypothetical protein DIZ80_02025 [endosymbiont of Galathealinum brachiosum]